jgi:hypothetical protein
MFQGGRLHRNTYAEYVALERESPAAHPSSMRTSIFFLAALAACSSSTTASPSTDDASLDGASADTATEAGGSFKCASAPPTPGAPCTTPGPGLYVCEYGGDAHGACTTVYECSTTKDGSHWTVREAIPDCGKNAADCPATYAAKEGQACTSARETCDYDQGRCGCEQCQSDAGTKSIWRCRTWGDASTTGCPATRPLLGTACATEGQSCNYYHCCSPPDVGPFETCVGGTWTQGLDGSCSCAIQFCP